MSAACRGEAEEKISTTVRSIDKACGEQPRQEGSPDDYDADEGDNVQPEQYAPAPKRACPTPGGGSNSIISL